MLKQFKKQKIDNTYLIFFILEIIPNFPEQPFFMRISVCFHHRTAVELLEKFKNRKNKQKGKCKNEYMNYMNENKDNIATDKRQSRQSNALWTGPYCRQLAEFAR